MSHACPIAYSGVAAAIAGLGALSAGHVGSSASVVALGTGALSATTTIAVQEIAMRIIGPTDDDALFNALVAGYFAGPVGVATAAIMFDQVVFGRVRAVMRLDHAQFMQRLTRVVRIDRAAEQLAIERRLKTLVNLANRLQNKVQSLLGLVLS